VTDGKGAAPPKTAPRQQHTNTDKDAGKDDFTKGDGAGEDVQTGWAFIAHLNELGVSLFTAQPGGRIDAWPNDEGELVEVIQSEPDDPEFVRPRGWPGLTAEGNDARVGKFRDYMALCANCGTPVAVVDVDPRNGGDIQKVRALLARLKVRVFAEVATPGGGRHFYVAGHEDLPSTSWKKGDLADYPGVDIQSHGRNVFIFPTMRPKYGYKGYTVVFDDLAALGTEGDALGAEALAAWVAEQKHAGVKKKCAGLKKKSRERGQSGDFDFEPAPPWTGGAPDASQQAYLDRVLEENAHAVATTASGGRNEALFLAALKCSSFVAGAGMDRRLVVDVLADAAAECGLVDDDGIGSVHATLRSAFRIGIQNPRVVPESVANPAGVSAPAHECQRLEDAYIGKRIADDYLADRFLHSGVFGWMKFDGRRWQPVEQAVVAEVIRQGVIEFHRAEAQAGANADRLKNISALFSAHRLKAVLWVAKGYLTVDNEEFDAHPDLLNVRNGVVDLRDGTLHPHDPLLRFTKVTMVDYQPGAVHDDWGQALTALPAEVADWLQLRWGQGLTGHPVPDDVMVVLKGAGENGKTTLVDSVREAVGPDYAVVLPDRVLLARSGDHPTELMTLRGARLAFMEEFPELGHLNVKRLKDMHGTGRITARYIGKDSVSWQVTHTIFVTTNYLPRVDESDHGTWRRLLLVEFPYRYRKRHETVEMPTDRRGDPDLRDRLRRGAGGQHEAILAWLVTGAVRWYQRDKTMPEPPESVRSATDVWRMTSDLLLRYINDNLVFDPDAHVMAKELYEDFAEWLNASGHLRWTDQNFSARFAQHPAVCAPGVEKQKGVRSSRRGLSRSPRPHNVAVPKQYAAWTGVRFRVPSDTDTSAEGVA
jgi:P4 family phage/plasmid primase-like protien